MITNDMILIWLIGYIPTYGFFLFWLFRIAKHSTKLREKHGSLISQIHYDPDTKLFVVIVSSILYLFFWPLFIFDSIHKLAVFLKNGPEK